MIFLREQAPNDRSLDHLFLLRVRCEVGWVIGSEGVGGLW